MKRLIMEVNANSDFITGSCKSITASEWIVNKTPWQIKQQTGVALAVIKINGFKFSSN